MKSSPKSPIRPTGTEARAIIAILRHCRSTKSEIQSRAKKTSSAAAVPRCRAASKERGWGAQPKSWGMRMRSAGFPLTPGQFPKLPLDKSASPDRENLVKGLKKSGHNHPDQKTSQDIHRIVHPDHYSPKPHRHRQKQDSRPGYFLGKENRRTQGRQKGRVAGRERTVEIALGHFNQRLKPFRHKRPGDGEKNFQSFRNREGHHDSNQNSNQIVPLPPHPEVRDGQKREIGKIHG